MNWYLQNGKDSDVVISSRIRLARNQKNTAFVNSAKKSELLQRLEKLETVAKQLGYGLKMKRLRDMSELDKMCLVEKHMISPDFARNGVDIGAILINEAENICIMIHEEDHIRIQTFASGLDLEHALELSKELETAIGENFPYAFHEQFGYLTACPTNVGTGLKAFVMVHLPGLTQTGNVSKILEIMRGFGLNIRGVYGERSDTRGDVYQISNLQTIGITEKEIVNRLQMMMEKLIEQERLARRILARNSVYLEDKVYRAYGILSNCRKLSLEECENYISCVKLGTDLGILKELNDLKIKKLDLYTKPAHLQKLANHALEENEREIERAKMVQKIIQE